MSVTWYNKTYVKEAYKRTKATERFAIYILQKLTSTFASMVWFFLLFCFEFAYIKTFWVQLFTSSIFANIFDNLRQIENVCLTSLFIVC